MPDPIMRPANDPAERSENGVRARTRRRPPAGPGPRCGSRTSTARRGYRLRWTACAPPAAATIGHEPVTAARQHCPTWTAGTLMRRNPLGIAIVEKEHAAGASAESRSLLAKARPRPLEWLGAAALVTLAALAIGAYWLSEPDELTDGHGAQTAAPFQAPSAKSLRRKSDSALTAASTVPCAPMPVDPDSARAFPVSETARLAVQDRMRRARKPRSPRPANISA